MSAHLVTAPADVPAPDAAPGLPPAPRRAVALDALRGLAILMMVFSGVLPWDNSLPRWMYHAQEPPPWHKFNPALPGITWVDLVFPFFLFALGAAIPLALASRRQRGGPGWQPLVGAAQRLVLLVWFALYFEHIRPSTLSPHATARTWETALLGWALFFPVLTRLPAAWSRWRVWAVRAIGWVGTTVLLASLRYPDGSGFQLHRSDIIILVLANMAFFGTLIWLATPGNMLLRLGVIPLFIAMRLAASQPGWVQTVWAWTPADWLFQWDYLKYLCLVLPGTVAGDLIVQWLNAPHEDEKRPGGRLWLLALLGIVLIVGDVAGLEARWVVRTTEFSAVLGALALVARPAGATGRLIQSLVRWGVYWLALGLLLEPFEGGIKKDHSTLSYYFVMSGLALFALSALTVFVTASRKHIGFRLLIANGQNPMIAYVSMNTLIQPLLALTGLETLLSNAWPEGWPAAGRGALETLALALIVALFTRFKVFWRT